MNTQLHSPLFNTLPPELRNRIFALALTPHTDNTIPFKRTAFYYRPNFRRLENTHPSVSLLQTCKLIYQETYHLPLENYVHVAWFYRGPPSYPHHEYISRQGSLSEVSINSWESPNSSGVYLPEVADEANNSVYQPSDSESEITDEDNDSNHLHSCPEPGENMEIDDQAQEEASPAMEETLDTDMTFPIQPSSASSSSTDLSFISGTTHASGDALVPTDRPNRLQPQELPYPPPYPSQTRRMHLFMQQFWLYDWPKLEKNYRGTSPFMRINTDLTYPREIAFYSPTGLRKNAKDLRELRVTIRHSDWYWWESGTALKLDAKQANRPQHADCGEGEGFDEGSWGTVFEKLPTTLEIFELELETVEGKKHELNAIVERAYGWRFPLPDGERKRELVAKKEKTTRKGWWGERLADVEAGHWEGDPDDAKKRLEAEGVDFRVEDGEEEILTEDRMTYYVVTIRYEARDIEAL